jgi:hypothetical protein
MSGSTSKQLWKKMEMCEYKYEKEYMAKWKVAESFSENSILTRTWIIVMVLIV